MAHALFIARNARADLELPMPERLATSAARSIGSGLGRQVVRGVLGSILGASKRR